MSKRKTFLILHPHIFSEFKYYTYELLFLEKQKHKVIVHDLSNIVSNNRFNKLWKTKKEKKAKQFSSLFSWINEFKKIRKKKGVLIYDLLDYGDKNFQLFIIKLFLKYSKIPILKYGVKEVADWKPKKNIKFFLRKIFEHKFNLNVYLFAIKQNFFTTLIGLIKFEKIFMLTNKNFSNYKNKKNIRLLKAHSWDYSNSLVEKYKNKHQILNSRYVVFLDTGVPYFAGDSLSDGRKQSKDNYKVWYKELNLFFNKIEKYFKAKVIVIPHSKYKIPNLKKKNINPHFNNRLNDNSYNAAAKLIPKCLFVISLGSTAVSHAIFNYKPVQFIYSTNYSFGWNFKEDLFLQANLIGMKPINISLTEKGFLIKNFKVNKSKYDLYKYKCLTYKNKNFIKPNYKIISTLMKSQI